ncbi:regulator of DNA class I crossover intermediates 1 [Pituophis catenifer annectens]|uniref:regulator of DNA class I crossover intermediates 1 n=1 Tax=Pituophis catenifer annectens TaxID=94852 RepID=UPI003994513E
MNWVGGSRRRIMLTKERRKQKDFFEKEKLKSKMKLLGVSPLKSSAVSLDLLNLYVVNQISTKKENAENIRKPIHVDINRETKIPLRKQNVDFPKSPECRPAKLSLDDIQHRIQEEILDSRRKYLSEKASIHSEELGSSWPVNNNKDEDFWLSMTAYRPEEFSASDSETPVGLYFQQLTSPGYGISIDKDSGKSQANGEESLFDTINDQIKTNQDANFQPIASLFEEKNQFLTFPPSQSYCSFANKSHIDQLFTDFGDAKEIFGKPSLYDGEEMHEMIGPAHCVSERDLTSILTAPEMICSLNNRSLNSVNQNPNWNQFKHGSIQKKNPVELSDQQKLTTFFDNIGGFKNQMKCTKVPKPIKSYLKNSRKKDHSDPDMDYLKIFEHETLDKEVYSDFDQHWKQSRQNDDDSQLSSQSPTYSPEQADRHTSSSSDESKPEEGNEGASSDSEGSFSRTYSHPCSRSGHQRSEYVCQFDGRHRNTTNIRSQAKSAITPRKNTLHRAGLLLSGLNDKGKHEASCQTEPVEKSNAAVQCDIIQRCPCKKELSFAHSAEMVTSTSKVDATGGQNVPADSAALQPPNSNSLSTNENLSPETDGFIAARSA